MVNMYLIIKEFRYIHFAFLMAGFKNVIENELSPKRITYVIKRLIMYYIYIGSLLCPIYIGSLWCLIYIGSLLCDILTVNYTCLIGGHFLSLLTPPFGVTYTKCQYSTYHTTKHVIK